MNRRHRQSPTRWLSQVAPTTSHGGGPLPKIGTTPPSRLQGRRQPGGAVTRHARLVPWAPHVFWPPSEQLLALLKRRLGGRHLERSPRRSFTSKLHLGDEGAPLEMRSAIAAFPRASVIRRMPPSSSPSSPPLRRELPSKRDSDPATPSPSLSASAGLIGTAGRRCAGQSRTNPRPPRRPLCQRVCATTTSSPVRD